MHLNPPDLRLQRVYTLFIPESVNAQLEYPRSHLHRLEERNEAQTLYEAMLTNNPTLCS